MTILTHMATVIQTIMPTKHTTIPDSSEHASTNSPSSTVSSRDPRLTITELMRVLQFGDSVVPVGAFSFSNGLESAIHLHFVHDLETLRQFVMTATHQSASADAIALLAAHRAACAHNLPDALRADTALFNRKINEEMRTMSVRMGKKLAEMAIHLIQTPLLTNWLRHIERKETPGTYPVCLGLLFAELSLPEHDAFAAHQYGAASMILSASLRLMKIHHLDAQSILFEVNTTTEAAYTRVSGATLDDMATFSPSLDIMAAAHVKAHVRMFMN
ncbi:MAG: Urease accessory protein UreF [Nitrospira sp.]